MDHGGSGLRGFDRGRGLVSGVGKGMGHNKEESLFFKNKPSFSEASSDWKITGSRQGRDTSFLLSLAYCEHWKMM